MHKLSIKTVVITLSLALAGCYESSSEESPPPAAGSPPPPSSLPGLTTDGSTYYQTNCASCHMAGADDITSAFGASDLAQKQDMIVSDMSNYDSTSTFNLMGAFSAVPDQRVADLRAYFASLPRI